LDANHASQAGVSADAPNGQGLQKTLGPVMLWGLGVGYVISGEYFGWNLGLAAGGTGGLFVAFVLVASMYIAFVFSYAELACAIPRAGGGFIYGIRGLGRFAGYLTGIAQLTEFVFAPPAIAMAIGAYVKTTWADCPEQAVAIVAYLIFTLLNVWGVRQTALFELVITVLAVGEIVLFSSVVGPHFHWQHMTQNAWPAGAHGVMAALPFAVWFFLAIEGVANAAEEARNPQRDVLIGFGSALFTLIVLSSLVLVCATGVAGWEPIVYQASDLTSLKSTGTGYSGWVVAEGAERHDSPLPMALSYLSSDRNIFYNLLVGVGCLGLIASLNGILLIASRALFEMGRMEFLPAWLGKADPKRHTPIAALWTNFAFGVVAILVCDTGKLITMAAMGAALLYILSMQAMINLRTSEPNLPRPFRTPGFPFVPRYAQLTAIGLLGSMLYSNFHAVEITTSVSVWFLAWFGVATAYYLMFRRTSR